jgi:hypothetical protein
VSSGRTSIAPSRLHDSSALRSFPIPDPRLQFFPGRTLVSNASALFFSTLPSSGSEGIMLAKFLASFSVM